MNAILDNAKEFLESANDNEVKKRYNVAVSDYFKAIVIYCDAIIYEQRKMLPKNHSERFDILKNYFPELYSLISPLFRHYTDSYNNKLSQKDVEVMKKNAAKIKGIAESFKKT